MSVIPSPTPAASSAVSGTSPFPVAPAVIDASCRPPLVALFLGAAVWLLIASAFGLIASIKFHAPEFLADPGWLTYGRVRPASINAMLYGFCLPAGLGVALWMFARLGRTPLVAPWLVVAGALVWNLGVAAGVWGILAGGSTGFESLEMPVYAASLVFLGYVTMAVPGVLTLHQRRERELRIPQWFLLTALFWFPWIYSTANLLLLVFPVRGMAQATIAWWHSHNLATVWFGLVGLAVVFHLLPKLRDRELHSRALALLTFWTLILFGSWGGIPASAPLPAWLPTFSTVARVLTIVAVIAVGLNVMWTLKGTASGLRGDPSLRFIGFGVGAFIIAGLLIAATAFPSVSRFTQFTWFTPALGTLSSYGFFAMVSFGAIYYVVPQLVGQEFPSPRLVRAHFWVAAVGVLLFVVPLAVGGIVQGLKLQRADIPFNDIARGTLLFLRVSTMGDLLLAIGHLMLLVNLGWLVCRFYQVRMAAAWVEATTKLEAVEARP